MFWHQLGGGMLGKLLSSISSRLEGLISSLEVVSVADNSASQTEAPRSPIGDQEPLGTVNKGPLKPSVSVWLTATTPEGDNGHYMDSVKLQGLIGLNLDKV